MIKIFKIPNYCESYMVISQFFDYEFGTGNWSWGSLEESILLAADGGHIAVEKVGEEGWYRHGKPVVHFQLTHLDEEQDSAFENWLTHLAKENTFIVSDLICKNPIKNYIQVDWTFNIFKAYHIKKYPYSKGIRGFYFKDCNVKNEVLDAEKKTKIFLSVGKTHKSMGFRTCQGRRRLIEFLVNSHIDKGHIGNPDDSDLWLADNSFSANNIDDLINLTKTKDIMVFGKNYPHIFYFQDTFISLYGETCEGPKLNTALTFTEKTITPLAQGHFILPIAVQGYIEYLKSVGFLFPSEIDYSYDLEVDYQTRINLYFNELNRLLSKSIEEWRVIWNNNLHIIKHNRSLIWDSPITHNNLLKRLGVRDVV